MKLSHVIVGRLSVALIILLSLWAGIFYFSIIQEIEDETDDALENYAEIIIRDFLTGYPLPAPQNLLNNTYEIKEVVSPVSSMETMYYDEMRYIASKQETEPCRTMRTYFATAEDKLYQLTISIPTIEKADLQTTILWLIVTLYLLLLIIILLLNTWIISRSFRSLYRLIRWMEQFRLDGSIPPLENKNRITEFRQLNEAVIHLFQRNAQMYTEQKKFISHAAHELQTPLAVSRNKLELLMQDESLSEQQMEQIYHSMQSLNHLIQLNKTLLLYSRIENRQFTEKEPIVVNDLLRELAENWAEVYAHKNIAVEWQEEGTYIWEMHPMLARVLLDNLLKNAYFHNHPQGRIRITLHAQYCSIANTGEPTALDGKLIFQHFYHGNAHEQSTGLGLSIVASIGETYGMDIAYHYHAPFHTFTVKKKKGNN